MVCGQYVKGALKTTEIDCGAKTANRRIVTPDKGGTMALSSDIVQKLGLQTYGDTNLTIDWSNGSPVYITLSGDTTINAPAQASDGQVMEFYIENPTGIVDTSHTYKVSWPYVAWAGTAPVTPPVQSPPVAGLRVVDHYRIVHTAEILFGYVVAQDYRIAIHGGTATAPNITSAQALFHSTTITITFDTNLTGGSLAKTDFTVKVASGATVTINRATAGGTNGGTVVTVDTDHVFVRNDDGNSSISYSGTDLKSLQGDPIGAFTTDIEVIGSDPHGRGGGGGNGIGTPPHIIP
jgi:hypothetical protein